MWGEWFTLFLTSKAGSLGIELIDVIASELVGCSVFTDSIKHVSG